MHLENISYSYNSPDSFALQFDTLSLQRDTVTSLIGTNGSGKSTLIKILTGQHINYKGTYTINGSAVENLYGDLLNRYEIGYAPEYVVLDEDLTGLEICTIVQDIRSIDAKAFESELAFYKKSLYIEDWFEKKPCRDYSQGMRKKISLLIAFLGELPYVILDEPTNGLDPLAVFGLKQIIIERRKMGKGTLVASHILDFVEKLADSITILFKGDLLFHDSLSMLYKKCPDRGLDEIYFSMYNEKINAN